MENIKEKVEEIIIRNNIKISEFPMTGPIGIYIKSSKQLELNVGAIEASRYKFQSLEEVEEFMKYLNDQNINYFKPYYINMEENTILVRGHFSEDPEISKEDLNCILNMINCFYSNLLSA